MGIGAFRIGLLDFVSLEFVSNLIFSGMIELLESRGMVTYACKGAPRMAKVSLRMDEDQVAMALEDKALLGGIVDDVSCIVK